MATNALRAGSSNTEFSAASRGLFTTKDVNRMEARFLSVVKYQVNVSQALYASCYFELRALCERQDEVTEEVRSTRTAPHHCTPTTPSRLRSPGRASDGSACVGGAAGPRQASRRRG